MEGSPIELNQMRYFLEVARTQHMTRSAEALHIAQPALTQAIRRLENDLGVPLFAAKGRNIILTEYGRFLQQQLTPLVQALDAVPARLQAMARQEANTLRLKVLAASALMTEAVIQYRADHPDLRFQVTQDVANEQFDICVSTRMPARRPAAEEADRFVCEEQIFLAVPAASPYAARQDIALADVAEEGFISLMGSRQLRWICDQFCRQAGFTPRIAFESDSPAAVQNMIAAHVGVGFWPAFTWGRLPTEGVRLLPIRAPVCRRELVVERRRNKVDNAVTDDYFTFLQQYIQQANRP